MSERDELLQEIELLKTRLEEVTEALALTNEKMNKFIQHESNMVFDDGRLWLKLNLKKIENMSKEELQALNDKVYEKYIGTTVKSKDAVKQPTLEQTEELYMSSKDKTKDDALLSLAKLTVSRWIEELQEDAANEIPGQV